MKMEIFQGNPAASGKALGPSFRWELRTQKIPRYEVADLDKEITRILEATKLAYTELEGLAKVVSEQFSKEEGAIFGVHLMILGDKALRDRTIKEIHKGINAEFAWNEAINYFSNQLELIQDDTLKQRATDIRDVGERVLKHLSGKDGSDKLVLSKPVILVANDLTPSQTALLDKKFILAVCTAEGGSTSHSAILAKALGIPAVVGIGPNILLIPNESTILVDGYQGTVVVNPGKDSINKFDQEMTIIKSQDAVQKNAASNPAISLDGHPIEVFANVGSVAEATSALNYGAEGIGLLRTEFLYLDSNIPPTEEQQFKIYSEILDIMENRPVVVRTLDIGGDKPSPYLDLSVETNPFLGWRAIRLCLARPGFFKVQLRALLRASSGHQLRIMFPMIATLDEVRQAKQLLSEAKNELGDFEPGKIQVGIMVEIPSVSLLAEHFAAEVDFFSIGTNDLTQYTFAADRTNDKLAYLSDACHPAILRQIDHVVQVAHKAGIWVGLCGELAGDLEIIPILLGLGLDELSMAPPLIPGTKSAIRKLYESDARKLALSALELESAIAVRKLVRSINTDN
jgi:phosphoenolpyruvate-protein phosphotransferase